jgi:hypothetical protein
MPLAKNIRKGKAEKLIPKKERPGQNRNNHNNPKLSTDNKAV